MNEVTRILDCAQQGNAQAAGKLLPLLYEELRKLAASKMAREIPGQTPQPTALVHEAWLRLSQQSGARRQNREHFYAMAAEVKRRILERARLGDAKAAKESLPLVYDELRRLAAVKMAHELPGQTLQPTPLVH
jgi:hypothetical protein